MKSPRLPKTDSIQELASFWDAHDLTEFENALEEVPESVFARKKGTSVRIVLPPREIQHVRRIARSKGVNETAVLREWILERLHESS